MSSTKVLAIVGAIALIGIGVYAYNESQKSDIEKIADEMEDVGEELEDAVGDRN